MGKLTNVLKKIFDYKLLCGFITINCLKFRYRSVGFPIRRYGSVFIENLSCITFGNGVTIARNCYISPIDLEVGDNVWLGINNVILGIVKIGNHVMIGPNTVIVGANHATDIPSKPMKNSGLLTSGIDIGDDVWIGANVSILDGVTVGSGSVIAAGAVVTKSIPPGSIAAGVPAKVIKRR